jgi:hypothetical protein
MTKVIEDLRRHDILVHVKFHGDWFRHSSNIMVIT